MFILIYILYADPQDCNYTMCLCVQLLCGTESVYIHIFEQMYVLEAHIKKRAEASAPSSWHTHFLFEHATVIFTQRPQ